MDETTLPNEQQHKFLALVARGIPVPTAARQAGYAESYAKKAFQLLKLPHMALALAKIQADLRAVVVYDCARAMAECAEAMTLAKEHKNAYAFTKAVELRSRLSGLLVEKVEVVHIDLRQALNEARGRVLVQLNPNIVRES